MADHRITKATGMLMMCTALCIDLIQAAIGLMHFVPVVGNAFAALLNTAVSVLAGMTFFLWFRIKGVRVFFGRKPTQKMVNTTLSVIIELIPIVKLLPAWTFWTWRTVTLSRIGETRPTPRTQRSVARTALRRNRQYAQ